MFNSKKIKDLEERIYKLEWQLKNTPKYKVGDKTKTGIICEVLLKPRIIYSRNGCSYDAIYSWQYSEVRTNNNEIYIING